MIINRLIDIIYGTNRVVKEFELAYPGERVIAASGVKGVKSTPKTEVDTGAKWIVSRRAVAILSDQRIKCGDWDIPLEEIESAELINLRGLISKGQLLNISTRDNIGYQMGMQLNPDWLNSDQLNLQYVNKKIKISTFSWLMRIVLILYLVYHVYKRLM